MAFADTRNIAELLLAPRQPASRSVVNFSSLKLNLGGTAAPGFISDASQLAGPLRTSLGASIAKKTAVEGLAGSVNDVLANFDQQTTALRTGAFVPPDPLLAVPSTGVPNVASFFAFSALKPGAPIPANFDAVIQSRKTQLQSLSKTFSSIFTTSSFGGVSITEDINPSAYPLPGQLDVPSVPRLAQGGSAAQSDPILQDKIAFVVHGVPIAGGKPSSWSRGLNLASNPPPNLNPTVGQIFRDRKNSSTWSEPVTAYNAQFPYNRVQQSASGHLIEIDDTPGAERVHIFHRSGSFIEFHPDGSVVYKNMKDGYLISMANQYVKVNGKCHIAVDGGVTIYSKSTIDVQADGDINVQTKGDYNVFAQNINLRAKSNFKADGTKIDLRYVTLPSDIMLVLPMGGGPFFAPKVNIGAIAADFPNNNLIAAAAAPRPMASAPSAITLGAAADAPPPETPLSNFSIYSATTPEAQAYRAHMFDTPEETNDFELYTAHTGLQSSLGDYTESPRQLGGKLISVSEEAIIDGQTFTPAVAPATLPDVNYLNYADYKGTYIYANNYSLGGTSFNLSDVTDVSIHSSIISDTTLTDTFEDVPADISLSSAGPATSSNPPPPPNDFPNGSFENGGDGQPTP